MYVKKLTENCEKNKLFVTGCDDVPTIMRNGLAVKTVELTMTCGCKSEDPCKKNICTCKAVQITCSILCNNPLRDTVAVSQGLRASNIFRQI